MDTKTTDPVKPLTALSNPSLEKAPIQRDSKDIAEEYKSVVAMIQDTGRNIWVIHGSFLVVAGFITKVVLEAMDNNTGLRLALSGVLGLVIVTLWLASFERNYAFYEFRIHYARSLEAALGYAQFTLGKELADKGSVEVSGAGTVNMSWLARHGLSIRRLGSTVILLFGVAFLAAAVTGTFRLVGC